MQTPSDRRVVEMDERLQIDLGSREVVVEGERIGPCPTEWRLLYHLVQNAGWLPTHEMILSKVWGPEYVGRDNHVRLYTTYFHKKIEPDPAEPRYLLTERGMGYRFVDFAGKDTLPRLDG